MPPLLALSRYKFADVTRSCGVNRAGKVSKMDIRHKLKIPLNESSIIMLLGVVLEECRFCAF